MACSSAKDHSVSPVETVMYSNSVAAELLDADAFPDAKTIARTSATVRRIALLRPVSLLVFMESLLSLSNICFERLFVYLKNTPNLRHVVNTFSNKCLVFLKKSNNLSIDLKKGAQHV